jgi:hypothetical protein
LRTAFDRSVLKASPEMSEPSFQSETTDAANPAISPGTGAEHPKAWEMIENGRYQPRRITGSYVGRELG